MGTRSERVGRDAARGLPDRRASTRHEPQRGAGVDVLPEHARVQRPPFPGGRRHRPRAHHAQGVQRLAPRGVVRRSPGPLHASGDRAHLGHGRAGRRGQADGGQGLPGDQHARAPIHPGTAVVPERLLGPLLPHGQRRRRGRVPAHRHGSRRHQHGARLLSRQLHGPRHPGHRARGAGPAVGPGVPEVPRPQGCLLRRRDRLDPVPARPRRPALRHPAVDPPGLRRQVAEPGVPRALTGVLHLGSHHAEARATRSASTSSPSNPTTPTPTRSGPTPPSRSLRSASRLGCRTRTSRRSAGATSRASATTTRSP